jgi:DNA mismatch repair protein MutL
MEAVSASLDISGLAALPTHHRPTTLGQHLVVNRRPVRDPLLRVALRVAYRDIIPAGRHPAAALFLQVPPESVDVNVHPMKTELRFREGDAVRGALISALRKALAIGAGTVVAVPSLGGATPLAGFSEALPVLPQSMPRPAGLPQPRLPLGFRPPSLPPPPAPEPPDASHPLGRAVAQLLDTYIVAEAADGALVLVDQHAAHERLTHEALTAQLREGSVRSQPLLVPAVVDMPPADAARLLGASEALARLGLEIEGFGAGAVLVRSLPALLGAADPAPLLRDMAEELAEDAESTALDRKLDAAIARLACHGSIRAGRRLNAAEMDALLRQMEATPRAATCSHGRPTVLKLDRAALERMFGRR